MDCYDWKLRFEMTTSPALAYLFLQRGAVSINLAKRLLKLVQRVIEPAPRLIHGLHLLAESDPLLHLNVVLLDAILYLTFKVRDFSLKLCDQYVVGCHLLVELGDTLRASFQFRLGEFLFPQILSRFLFRLCFGAGSPRFF